MHRRETSPGFIGQRTWTYFGFIPRHFLEVNLKRCVQLQHGMNVGKLYGRLGEIFSQILTTCGQTPLLRGLLHSVCKIQGDNNIPRFIEIAKIVPLLDKNKMRVQY